MNYIDFVKRLEIATSAFILHHEINRNYVEENITEIMDIRDFDIMGLVQPRYSENPNRIEVKFLYKAEKSKGIRKVFKENIKKFPNKHFSNLNLKKEIHHELLYLPESKKLTTHLYEINLVPLSKAQIISYLTNEKFNIFLKWDEMKGNGPAKFKQLDEIIAIQGIVMTIMESIDSRLKIRYYQGGEDHSEFDHVLIDTIENSYRNYFVRDKEYIFKDKQLGMPFVELQYMLY